MDRCRTSRSRQRSRMRSSSLGKDCLVSTGRKPAIERKQRILGARPPRAPTACTLPPMPVYSLNGKVALVTGAARGIGFETARQIHMRGGSLAVLDLDPDQAREAAERIGERAIGIGADVTDHGAMMAAVAETVERFGG